MINMNCYEEKSTSLLRILRLEEAAYLPVFSFKKFITFLKINLSKNWPALRTFVQFVYRGKDWVVIKISSYRNPEIKVF